jgi:hypothetical protein
MYKRNRSGGTGRARRRGLLAAGIAMAVTAVALLISAAAGASDAPTANPTITANTYLFGPHQGADSTTFKHECSADESGLLSDGKVLWHFVLPQTLAENSGQLEALFSTALQVGPIDMTKHVGGVIHWDVITPGDDVLLDAWTDATSNAPSQPPDTNRRIRLSHVCGGGGATEFDATLATKVHDASHNDITNSSVALGTAIHDLATVSPVTGDVGSGTVHYSLYNGLDCGDPGTFVDTVDVALGTDNTGDEPGFPNSLAATTTPRTLGAGDYSYLVSADLTSSKDQPLFVMADACEPFTVNQSQLAMDSKVHDANDVDQTNKSVPLGSIMHDTGKITGGAVSGFATEAITFKFYAGDKCEGDGTSVANTGADEGDATRDRSTASAALGAGSYSYKAFVAGNNNYIGTDSGCEPFTVNKGDLQIRTDIHNALHQVITSADAGAVVHDTATLSGAVTGFNPDLTKVSFTFYTNGNCSPTGTTVANGTPESTYVAKSIASAALAPGDYSYRASFAGDGNYNPVGPATCEPLHVFRAGLTIGYWGNHLAPNGTAGCNKLPSGTSCGSNGPFTNQYLGNVICISPTCPSGIIVGTLGNTTITTFSQAATVFKNNNCSNASSSDANAAACLAAQLLGAELNVANGANPCVCATIKSAIALLKAVSYDPITNKSNFTGSGYTRQNALTLKTALDNYNNAKGCPA